MSHKLSSRRHRVTDLRGRVASWGKNVRKPISAAIAVTLGIVAIVGGVALPSQAASFGNGFQLTGATGDGTLILSGLGSFSTSGTGADTTAAYCIDINAQALTSGDQAWTESSTSLAGSYSAQQLAQVNYAIYNFGGGNGNWGANPAVSGAATQAAVWILTGQIGADGSTSISEYGGNVYSRLATDAGTKQAVRDLAGQIVSAARANATTEPASSMGTAPAAPVVHTNGDYSHYAGTVTFPAGYTSLTLTNAVWAGGASTVTPTTPDQFANGGSISWTGTPPDGENRYQVSVQGDYTVGSAISGTYETMKYSNQAVGTKRGQMLVTSLVTTKGNSVSGTSAASASDPLSLRFSPIITTQAASRIVQVGETFTDNVTFSAKALDANDPDNTQKWYQSVTTGAYYKITAKGTLYGPLSSEPTESSTVPAGTPVAATATVTTDAVKGPGTYPVTTNEKARESGHYTWVWSVSYDDQTPLTQSFLPDNYNFADTFGQTIETSVTPFGVTYSTALSANIATIGSSLTDAITTSSVTAGAWLRDKSGARIPVMLTGTVYSTTSQPTQQAKAPADAKVVGTITATTTGPNQTIVSDPFDTPFTTGFVTVQWAIVKASQPAAYQGYVTDWSDDWGIPAETAQVVGPTVTTKATEKATTLDSIKDTAIVDGPVPDKSVVSFTAYKAPVVGDQKIVKDSSGNYVLAVDAAGKPVVWTAADIAALGDKQCSAQPVFVSKDVTVTKAGSYTSDAATPQGEGTYYWVETLSTVDRSGKTVVIHVGECGLPGETTIVSKPTVTTQATGTLTVGGSGHDTAIVSGPVPTASTVTTSVTFELFKKSGDTATCTPGNKVFDTNGAPVAVTTAGSYDSASYTYTEAGTYYWVETLSWVDTSGKTGVFHVGECGLPGETTTVTAGPVPVSPLANTSAAELRTPLLGGGTLLLVSGLVLGAAAARRKRAEVSGRR